MVRTLYNNQAIRKFLIFLTVFFVFLSGGCDLAFMVDISSSIGGDANFQLVMKFVISIFRSFTLGGGIRYGLVTFGSSAKVKVN